MKSFKIRLWLPLLIIIFLAVLMIDYFDVPSRIGFNVGNMNMSLVGIVAGAFITLSLFIITYYLIDQWNVRKNKNKQEIAMHVLKETYRSCKEDLELISEPLILNALVKHTDFDKANDETSPSVRYAKLPFSNESILMQLCSDGIVSAHQLECYLNLKTEYQRHCERQVTFFDAPEVTIITKMKVLEALSKAEKSLEQ